MLDNITSTMLTSDNTVADIKLIESEEFKLIKENIESINNYIEKKWTNDEAIKALGVLNDKVDLEKIIRLTKGMRTHVSPDGYNRASGEEISSEFFMNELLNTYKTYVAKHDEKPTLLILLETMLLQYKDEDLDYILKHTYALAIYQLPIYVIMHAYVLFKNELDKENQDFILSLIQISVVDIYSRSNKYLKDIVLLNRHYSLSKTNSEIFKLDICKITDKISKPIDYLYNDKAITFTNNPSYSFQLVESLLFNATDLYIKSVKNNDGVIEFITNKDEIISFLEYKELALIELAKYHEYIGQLIITKTNDIKNIGSNKIENTNDFITLLRKYRKGE